MLGLVSWGFVAVITIYLSCLIGAQRHQLNELSLIDPPNGLANRGALADRLNTYAQFRRHDDIGLLYLDLDNFKQVNSNYHHSGGDAVLLEVARRLQANVRISDMVARIGGDEFVIHCPELRDPADLHELCQRLVHELSRPYAAPPPARSGARSAPSSPQADAPLQPNLILQQADELLLILRKQAPGTLLNPIVPFSICRIERRVFGTLLEKVVSCCSIDVFPGRGVGG